MNNRQVSKILGSFGLCLIFLNLGGCSSSSKPYADETMMEANGATAQKNNSFASSAVCSENVFLQKYQCSFHRIEQAARAGDPDAQYALGYLYYYGIGTTQDRQTGLTWIKRSAAQGQPVAQDALKRLSGSSVATSSPAKHSNSSASEKALSDYLPNYGQGRVDVTQTPPSVDLNHGD